jgi:hypothetical protein
MVANHPAYRRPRRSRADRADPLPGRWVDGRRDGDERRYSQQVTQHQQDGERPRGRCVKLMADYSAFPLWAVPSHPGDYEWCGMLPPERLPLSASLVEQLQRWADSHDALLGPEFEWPSEEARDAFVDQGRRLLPLLRDELGRVGYEVVYFNDTTGQLER